MSDQEDLFAKTTTEFVSHKPLAARMRPTSLAEVVGQDHLLGEKSILPELIRKNSFGSILLYGPPGSGKTSLASVIAQETNQKLIRINAVSSNVAELRQHLQMARMQDSGGALMFIDELHRFNKSQQDLLLPDVEEGVIRLIGATTYNPGFYVIPALISRSHLFRLEPLQSEDIRAVLKKALSSDKGLANYRVAVGESVLNQLASISDGDLRRALNFLETLVLSQPIGGAVDEECLQSFLKERQIRYDASDDEHYDTISAFIKSIRGSDPDAAMYWLAKMLIGGEDPRFIARRLVILASEDVGLADSRGLPVAMAAYDACECIGMPECELNLAHATLFLATSPKSNSATLAIAAAKKSIRDKGIQPVPLWLRDSHTKTSRALGNGEEYLYSHDFTEGISGQEYMTHPQKFFTPGENGAEAAIAERLKRWAMLKKEKSQIFRKNSAP